MKKILCFGLLLITILLALPAKSVSAASNQYIYGDGKSSAYSIRLDSPHFNGDVYHVHFYKKTTHLYCMRLDNLQMCDANKSDRSSVPRLQVETESEKAEWEGGEMRYQLRKERRAAGY